MVESFAASDMPCATDDPDCLRWDEKLTPTGHSGSLDEGTERTLSSPLASFTVTRGFQPLLSALVSV